MLTEIRQCYMELDKFWTEEISRAVEALKMRRVDPMDLERWKNFHASLKKSVGFWKVLCIVIPVLRIPNSSNHLIQSTLSSSPAQLLRHNDACSSKVCPFSLSLWHLLRLTVRRRLTLG